jgi:hypothetical protein
MTEKKMGGQYLRRKRLTKAHAEDDYYIHFLLVD